LRISPNRELEELTRLGKRERAEWA